MTNYTDYLSHITTTPDYYQRNYENDLPIDEDSPSWLVQAEKAALIALPFISLYQPLGVVISLVMGAVRIITNLAAAIKSLMQGDVKAATFQMTQAALAI